MPENECGFCEEREVVDFVHIDAGGSITTRGVCEVCLRRGFVPASWPLDIREKWKRALRERANTGKA